MSRGTSLDDLNKRVEALEEKTASDIPTTISDKSVQDTLADLLARVAALESR